MKTKRLLAILIVGTISLTTTVVAVAHLSLRLPSLTGGGGRSEAGTTVLLGSLGQPIVGRVSSGSTEICVGYPGCLTTQPGISIADTLVVEGDAGSTTATFTVTLSAGTSQTVTVQYATADGTATAGSDYLANSGTLTLAPGTTATTIPVTVLGDVATEGDETFTLQLSNPTHAVLVTAQATGTIMDDEGVPSLRVLDVTVEEGDAGTTTAAFTVTLSHSTVETVVVQYATADGTATAGNDYLAVANTLTLTPGMTEATILVTIYGDTVIEGDEGFTMTLSNPANAILVRSQATGTIVDDEPPPSLSIADTAVTEGDIGTTTAIFTVTLSAATPETVTVQYATADGTATAGSDYAASSGTLTFAPGTVETTIPVDVVGDVEIEGDETFTLQLSNPTHAVLGISQAVGTIVDDEGVPSLRVLDITVPEGDGGMTAAMFTVTLSAPTLETVTVQYATTDGTATAGSDYLASSGVLTFAPGSTQTTIPVTVLGDVEIEGDETFTLQLSNPTHAVLVAPQVVGTIVDDDDAAGYRIYLPFIQR